MRTSAIRHRLTLTLLAKELVEQAARRRTYLLRVLFATLLLGFGGAHFYDAAVAVVDPSRALGEGEALFELLVGLELAGIYVFLPAMAAGCLTHEKERRSLSLLLLTGLRPTTILLEKYLGRLLPALYFLLLSLPLMAVAYAMGGVTMGRAWETAYLLVLTCVQVCALATACSAYFATTAGAVVGCYLIGLVVYFGPPLFVGMCRELGWFVGLPAYRWTEVVMAHFPPMHFQPNPPAPMWPVALTAGIFLLFARLFLVRRMALVGGNPMRRVFQAVDRVLDRANRFFGGVVLAKAKSGPVVRPVAWRELRRGVVGSGRHVVRVLLLLEAAVVVLAVAAAMGTDNPYALEYTLMPIFAVAAPVALLVVTATGAAAVASERSHQTLDVLLTTPLYGRRILLEKMVRVGRWVAVVAVPLATLALLDAWFMTAAAETRWFHDQRLPLFARLVVFLLSAAVYLPLAAGFSFRVGLRSRTTTRSLVGSVGGLVAWGVLPIVAGFFLGELFFDRVPWSSRASPHGPSLGLAYVTLLSPATVPVLTAAGQLVETFPSGWWVVSANFLAYAVCAVGLFVASLRHADERLGRAGGRRRERKLVGKCAGR